MASAYHRLHFPDLSPATRRIAERHRSKTSRMRISLVPLEPGRNSFKVLDLRAGDGVDQWPSERGPRTAQRVDGIVYQVGGLSVCGMQILKPGGDLAGQVDIPITHISTIANPIVEVSARLIARCRPTA